MYCKFCGCFIKGEPCKTRNEAMKCWIYVRQEREIEEDKYMEEEQE